MFGEARSSIFTLDLFHPQLFELKHFVGKKWFVSIFLYFILLCIVKSIRVHSLLWLVRRRGKLELSVNFAAQDSGLFLDYTQTQAGLALIMAW